MINWSGINKRGLSGKLLRLPLKLIPKQTILKIRQGPCRGMKWITGSSTHGCWLGTYELEKQKVLEDFLKSGMVIYDIGANAGFYTLLFSKLVGMNGKVFAFEPLAENVDYILKHISLNGINNVTVVPVALSDKRSFTFFNIAKSNSMGSITYAHTEFQIPTLTIDDLIVSYGFPMPDVIKMDVEGAESAVLNGMRKVMASKSTVIFVALHGQEQKRLCQRILLENKYEEIFYLSGKERILDSLENRPEDEIYALPAVNK